MTNIEELLIPTKPHIDLYKVKINEGINHLRESSITIACLVRDVESVIDNNISKIINFSKNYNIIFFENDSKDDTKNKLLKIEK